MTLNGSNLIRMYQVLRASKKITPNLFISSSLSERYASTYKAAVLKDYGEPLEIVEKKQPKIRPNEARIAIHSCAVNASDLLMFEDKYNHKKKLPFVPGFEICGEVLEIGGDINNFAVGQRVIGLNKEELGGFAEECVVNAKDLWGVDYSVGFETGASLAENYSTALLGLNRRAKINENSTVLVTAAAGGLGLAAVDLAANVYKAKVIGVCGTEDKANLVREKGAWAALKYNEKHLIKKVNEVTDGKGVDIIFDAVGGEIFTSALQCIANEGCAIVAGFASRDIETSQLLPRAVAVIGVSLTNYRSLNNEVYRQCVTDIIDMQETGLIKPHVSAIFKLEDTAEAFNFIRERKSTGKVVLEIR